MNFGKRVERVNSLHGFPQSVLEFAGIRRHESGSSYATSLGGASQAEEHTARCGATVEKLGGSSQAKEHIVRCEATEKKTRGSSLLKSSPRTVEVEGSVAPRVSLIRQTPHKTALAHLCLCSRPTKTSQTKGAANVCACGNVYGSFQAMVSGCTSGKLATRFYPFCPKDNVTIMQGASLKVPVSSPNSSLELLWTHACGVLSKESWCERLEFVHEVSSWCPTQIKTLNAGLRIWARCTDPGYHRNCKRNLLSKFGCPHVKINYAPVSTIVPGIALLCSRCSYHFCLKVQTNETLCSYQGLLEELEKEDFDAFNELDYPQTPLCTARPCLVSDGFVKGLAHRLVPITAISRNTKRDCFGYEQQADDLDEDFQDALDSPPRRGFLQDPFGVITLRDNAQMAFLQTATAAEAITRVANKLETIADSVPPGFKAVPHTVRSVASSLFPDTDFGEILTQDVTALVAIWCNLQSSNINASTAALISNFLVRHKVPQALARGLAGQCEQQAGDSASVIASIISAIMLGEKFTRSAHSKVDVSTLSQLIGAIPSYTITRNSIRVLAEDICTALMAVYCSACRALGIPCPKPLEVDATAEWCNTVVELGKNPNFTSEVKTNEVLARKVLELWKDSFLLLRLFPANTDYGAKIRNLLGTLNWLYKTARDSPVFCAKQRPVPFCFFLYGKPGQGKTTICHLLELALAKDLAEEESNTELMRIVREDPSTLRYSRAPDSTYFDGYNGQIVYSMDDFMQQTDANQTSVEPLEVISAVNSAPWLLNMAACESKSNVYFKSRFVSITSNVGPDAPKKILADPQAFNRRLHAVLHVSAKERFLQGGTVHPGLVPVGDPYSIYEIDLDIRSGPSKGEYRGVSFDRALSLLRKAAIEHRQLDVRTRDMTAHFITRLMKEDPDPQPSDGTRVSNRSRSKPNPEIVLTPPDRHQETEQQGALLENLSGLERLTTDLSHGCSSAISRLLDYIAHHAPATCEYFAALKRFVKRYLPAISVFSSMWLTAYFAKMSYTAYKRESEMKIFDSLEYLRVVKTIDTVRLTLRPLATAPIDSRDATDHEVTEAFNTGWVEITRPCDKELDLENLDFGSPILKLCIDDHKLPIITCSKDRDYDAYHIMHALNTLIPLFDLPKGWIYVNGQVINQQNANDVVYGALTVLVSGKDAYWGKEIDLTCVPTKFHQSGIIKSECLDNGRARADLAQVMPVETQSNDSKGHRTKRKKGHTNKTGRRHKGTVVQQGRLPYSVLGTTAKAIRANIWKVSQNDKEICSMLFVRDNVAIFPAHCAHLLKRISTISVQGAHERLSLLPQDFAVHFPLDQADLALFELLNRSRFAVKRDLISRFLTNAELSALDPIEEYQRAASLLSVEKEDGVMATIDVNVQFVHEPTRPGEIHAVYPSLAHYSADCKRGDCGRPLIMDIGNNMDRILGFHVLGNSVTGRGSSLVVTREMITELLEQSAIGRFTGFEDTVTDFVGTEVFDDEEAEVVTLGTTITPTMPSRSKLNPSLISGFAEPIKKPALLKPAFIGAEVVDPLNLALAKAAKTPTYIPLSKINAAVDEVFKHIPDIVEEPLTTEEAIRGLEDDDAYRGVNRATSIGWAHSLYTPRGNEASEMATLAAAMTTTKKKELLGNGDWILDHPLIVQGVKDLELLASRRQLYPVAFVDVLKDELRLNEKVDAGKTRSICAGPVVFTVAFRKYFLHFVSCILKGRIDNEIAVGVNVYDPAEWTRVATRVASRKQTFAGDFSNFDGSLNAQVIQAIMERIIDKHVCYNDTQKEVMCALAKMVINSNHVHTGILQRWSHGQPSGCPITSILNSLYNSVAARLVFNELSDDPFDQWGSMISYGDDNIFGFDGEYADPEFLTEFCATYSQFGMTYTSTTKNGLPQFQPITEVEFLKRRFKPCAGMYLAPKDLAETVEVVNWVRGPTYDVTNLKERIDDTLMELALHGKETFDRWRKVIVAACHNQGVEISTRSFASVIAEFADKYGPPYDAIYAALNRFGGEQQFGEGPVTTDVIHITDDGTSQDQIVPTKPEQDFVPAGEEETRVRTIVDFLERFEPIATVPITADVAKKRILAQYSIPIDVMTQMKKEKLKGFKNFSADVEIMIKPSVNPFVSGIIKAFTFMKNQYHTAGYAPRGWTARSLPMLTTGSNAAVRSATFASGCTSVDIDLGAGEFALMEVPYVSPLSHWDLTAIMAGTPTLSHLPITATAVIMAYTDIQTTAAFSIQIFARFKNVKLDYATYPTNTQATQLAILEKTLVKEGVAEAAASSLSRLIMDTGGTLEQQGFIDVVKGAAHTVGSVAEAAGGIVAKVGHVATGVVSTMSAVGLSKEDKLDEPQDFQMRLGRFFMNVDGYDSSRTIALSVNNSTRPLYGSGEDEMSFAHILSRWEFVGSGNWTTSNSAGHVLYSTPVSPCLVDGDFKDQVSSIPSLPTSADFKQRCVDFANYTFVVPTHLSFLARLFTYWRGTVKYRIRFAKTAFHTGRVRCIWLPGNQDPTYVPPLTSTTAANAAYFRQIIVDLKETSQVEFDVPYSNVTEYTMCSFDVNKSTFQDYNSCYSNGRFIVQSVTDLSVTGAASPKVPFVVEIMAGEDLHFAFPRGPIWRLPSFCAAPQAKTSMRVLKDGDSVSHVAYGKINANTTQEGSYDGSVVGSVVTVDNFPSSIQTEVTSVSSTAAAALREGTYKVEEQNPRYSMQTEVTSFTTGAMATLTGGVYKVEEQNPQAVSNKVHITGTDVNLVPTFAMEANGMWHKQSAGEPIKDYGGFAFSVVPTLAHGIDKSRHFNDSYSKYTLMPMSTEEIGGVDRVITNSGIGDSLEQQSGIYATGEGNKSEANAGTDPNGVVGTVSHSMGEIVSSARALLNVFVPKHVVTYCSDRQRSKRMDGLVFHPQALSPTPSFLAVTGKTDWTTADTMYPTEGTWSISVNTPDFLDIFSTIFGVWKGGIRTKIVSDAQSSTSVQIMAKPSTALKPEVDSYGPTELVFGMCTPVLKMNYCGWNTNGSSLPQVECANYTGAVGNTVESNFVEMKHPFYSPLPLHRVTTTVAIGPPQNDPKTPYLYTSYDDTWRMPSTAVGVVFEKSMQGDLSYQRRETYTIYRAKAEDFGFGYLQGCPIMAYDADDEIPGRLSTQPFSTSYLK